MCEASIEMKIHVFSVMFLLWPLDVQDGGDFLPPMHVHVDK